MRTFWLILCTSAGCAFDAPNLEDGLVLEDEGEDEPAPTGGTPAASTVCDRTDPALRLCVDFDQPLADRSASRAPVAASAVFAMERDGEPAASLSLSSTVHVPEDGALDIQGGLALDMWIRPTGRPLAGEGYWILDNNTQYGASFRETGAMRCLVAGRTVDSAPLPDDGQFHHVACTYNGATLKVFVDGQLSGCSSFALSIPTTGTSGLAIGANLSGTSDAPRFAESFVGGIDDVRVWARSNVDMCAAAGRTGCRTSCAEL